jgi:hypothetical protein
MPAQQSDRGHRPRPVGETLQDEGEPSRGPRDFHTRVRGVLGQTEASSAVRKERVALGDQDLARVELREVRDQLAGGLALMVGQDLHAGQKGIVTEGGGGGEHVQRHALL